MGVNDTSINEQIEAASRVLGRFEIESRLVDGQQYFMSKFEGKSVSPWFNTSSIALGLGEGLQVGKLIDKVHEILSEGGFKPIKNEFN